MVFDRTFYQKVAVIFISLLLAGSVPIAIIQADERPTRGAVDIIPTRNGTLPEPYDPGLDLPDLDPVYVIVCPEEFREEVRPLAVHRTCTGLPSRIYTIESITANYSGVDRSQKVHNFLRDLHAHYPSFKWLFIVGDSEHLMPRDLWHYAQDRGQPFGNNYTTDVYFAGLDSDWNNDGDDRFGEFLWDGNLEADLDWDVYVGRLPASNEEHVQNYVNKLLRYEKDPPVGSWMERFHNWGSLMEPPNRDFDPYRYFDHKSNAYTVCKRVEENLPQHLDVHSLYDYPRLEGGNYTPYDGNDTLNRNNMLASFNSGASMLNFVGQARYEAYALNDYGPPTGFGEIWDWNEPMRYSDHALFTNQDMMPFMYASTCDSAKFFNMSEDFNDKSLETWLTSGSGGIIGLISSTGKSARGEEQTRSWGNWYLDEEFWKLFLDQGVTRPGKTLYNLKDIYKDRWLSPKIDVKETILGMIYTYILLGDPFVDVYTDVAGRFEKAEDIDINMFTGERMTRFRVLDRDGEPVPNPQVTIYDQNLYITLKGNVDGWVNATIDLLGSSEINMTLCAHNMVPSFFKIPVERAISDVVILIDDLSMIPSDPSPGDEVRFDLDVRNIGGMDAENVQVTVGYLGGNGDPTYTFQHTSIGTIGMGCLETVHWNWTVRPGEHSFMIEAFSSSDDLDPFNNEIRIDFDNPGPDLKFFPGTGMIRPSNILPPCVDARVDIDIHNNGTAPSKVEVQVFLGDPEDNGFALTELVEFGPITAGGWLNMSMPFTSPNSTDMLYLVMDPRDLIPPDMVDMPFKTLMEINLPPEWITVPSLTLFEDSSGDLVRLDDKVRDPDNSSISLEFHINWSGPLELWISTSGNQTFLNCIPEPDVYGTFQVPITVSDRIAFDIMIVNVTVIEQNDPPVLLDVVSGTIEVTALEDSPFAFRLKAVDIEDDVLSFEVLDAPFEMDSVNGTMEWTPVQDDVGRNEFHMTVRDDRGASVDMVLVITVAEVNDPPVAEPLEDISLNSTDKYEFQILVTDEEGDNISYRSSSRIVIIDPDGMGQLNLTEQDVGVNNVRISISDGINTIHLSFNVTVNAVKGDLEEKDGPEIWSLIMVAVVSAGIFLFLLGGFIFLRRTRADSVVLSEMKAVDEIYRNDMEE
ncbi:MAG: C25 family cysteine peptidase [Candidatus Thermoplasmatota archaeon]|nr:C25 family cysteine peptidase [Candidatus Thermoplasmatota archaeon]